MDDATALPAAPHRTYTRVGSPENIEQYPIVEPFGDYRDEIARQTIRGDNTLIVQGEPLRSWLMRRARRWWE